MLRPIFLTVLVKKIDDSKNSTYLEHKGGELVHKRININQQCYLCRELINRTHVTNTLPGYNSPRQDTINKLENIQCKSIVTNLEREVFSILLS